MATWTITTLNSSIETTLSTATGIKRGQDIDELTETIPDADMPLLMVYCDAQNIANSETNRNSFGASPVIHQEFTFNCDVYVAKVGKKLSESMTDTYSIWQQIIDILDSETECPYFGDAAIRYLRYSSEFVTFNYSNEDFRGIRFKITIGTF